MRIEREGIGPRKPGHEIPKLRTHVEERPVGTVHVVPDPFAGAQVGDRIQRIDRARIRGAGRRHDAERSEPDPAIRGNRVGQAPHIHAELLIDRDHPDPVRHDAGQPGRLDHRVMHLRRAVQHARADLRTEMPLARTQHGVEMRHRPAGREQPASVGRELHPVAQPVERVGFELNECWCRQPHPGVAIDDVGNQIRQARGIQPAAWNVGKIAGSRCRKGPRHPLGEQLVEQRLVRDTLFGGRFAEATAEIRRSHVASGRLRLETQNVVYEPLDGGVPHAPHLVGREF